MSSLIFLVFPVLRKYSCRTIVTIFICLILWRVADILNLLTNDTDSAVTYPSFNFSIPNFIAYTANSTPYNHPIDLLPEDDYLRNIDLNFKFQILNVVDCQNTFLLVVVHSSNNHFQLRRTIRETWGQRNKDVCVVFLVGLPRSEALTVESDNFGDTVQGNFIDAYRNLTYKHVMGLKYAIYHCPHVKYILKTDDDVFINMPIMLEFLKNISPYGASRLLSCSIWIGKPWRTNSKWRVTYREYRKRTYPLFCQGWVVIYSADVVFDLYREAQESPYFWIDDVFVTGLMAEKLEIKHLDLGTYVHSGHNGSRAFGNYLGNGTVLIAKQELSAKAIKALWDDLQ